MNVNAQDVINDLAIKIGNLEAQNAVLRVQLNSYQQQESQEENEEK